MEFVAEKYVQTDFGKFPLDWKVSKIQELIDDSSIISHLDGNHGGLYPKSYEFKQTGVPYIGATDFVNGEVNFSSCKFLSKERAKEFRKGVAQHGDVLFAHNATVGPVAFLKTDLEFVILSTTATYFRCDLKKLNNQFLLYALQAPSFVKQYSSVMAQSTRFQVPIGAQRKLSFIIPTLEEQTAIATALSDADALINGLEKLIAKKRNIKQGAMQKLLQPKEGWEVKKLGEILKVKHGKDQKEVQSKNGNYPILGTGGLMAFSNEFLYDKPSVLIGRKGTIDKPQFMQTPFWTVDTLFYTEIFKGYDAKFIYYIFNLIDWYSYNEASGVPSLNAKTIEKIEKGFPSFTEQTRIANILSDMDNEMTALETKLEKYRKVKLGMMQNLLTGKIRLV